MTDLNQIETPGVDEPAVAQEPRQRRLRDLFAALIVSGEFYESLDRYQPSDEYLDVVRALLPARWRTERASLWYHCVPEHDRTPAQGWKIHVSATPGQAAQILAHTAEICVSEGVAFKFAADRAMFLLVNAKQWDRGAAGKFITIYPSSEPQFKKLLHRLARALHPFAGPYVLSDRRYGTCPVLYYRFGGLLPRFRLNLTGDRIPVIADPDGMLVPDERQPYFQLPSWVKDPFPEADSVDGSGLEMTLAGGRYRIISALSFSNTGGVYRGIDSELGGRW